ncbi:hypothetical protein IMCC3135_16235 [Granulosicoccus antarcticus IMCC3135]|uniref:Lipoprotein LppC n=2 Tax=Granulosicoccus TaxID=437504 RepID=A0A2Z2NPX6_9GAMM|nr:hypothetical protein IMCC3135_16235 [Granulosicoccus antarcticus IMCC3135]
MQSIWKQTLLCACLFNGTISLSLADESLTLSSPDFQDQGRLSLSSKCHRDGGQGLSPALDWTTAPEGTQSFVVMMQHYPKGSVEGRDAPSHYWSLWNIPADVHSLPSGNPESTGDEGADKDNRGVGFTPPCSPGTATHSYTITLYALNAAPVALGSKDSPDADWSAVMNAIEGKVLATSTLSFLN